MREILFRAKRMDNGEWVEGLPMYSINKSMKGTIDRFLILQDGYYNIVLISPETIGQYTGLTDRNGMKIFEGDIVDCSEKRGVAFWNCKVVWNELKARFDVVAMDCRFPMYLEDYDNNILINGSDYEFVGNIFDNPDSMKG